MVSKCANPDCSASFRYLRQGKLFRVDRLTGLERHRAIDGEPRKRRLEFFWLCEDCAAKMTLVFDRHSGIAVQANDYASLLNATIEDETEWSRIERTFQNARLTAARTFLPGRNNNLG